MPPLAQPLYYDENGNPIYEDPANAPVPPPDQGLGAVQTGGAVPAQGLLAPPPAEGAPINSPASETYVPPPDPTLGAVQTGPVAPAQMGPNTQQYVTPPAGLGGTHYQGTPEARLEGYPEPFGGAASQPTSDRFGMAGYEDYGTGANQQYDPNAVYQGAGEFNGAEEPARPASTYYGGPDLRFSGSQPGYVTKDVMTPRQDYLDRERTQFDQELAAQNASNSRFGEPWRGTKDLMEGAQFQQELQAQKDRLAEEDAFVPTDYASYMEEADAPYPGPMLADQAWKGFMDRIPQPAAGTRDDEARHDAQMAALETPGAAVDTPFMENVKSGGNSVIGAVDERRDFPGWGSVGMDPELQKVLDALPKKSLGTRGEMAKEEQARQQVEIQRLAENPLRVDPNQGPVTGTPSGDALRVVGTIPPPPNQRGGLLRDSRMREAPPSTGQVTIGGPSTPSGEGLASPAQAGVGQTIDRKDGRSSVVMSADGKKVDHIVIDGEDVPMPDEVNGKTDLSPEELDAYIDGLIAEKDGEKVSDPDEVRNANSESITSGTGSDKGATPSGKEMQRKSTSESAASDSGYQPRSSGYYPRSSRGYSSRGGYSGGGGGYRGGGSSGGGGYGSDQGGGFGGFGGDFPFNNVPRPGGGMDSPIRMQIKQMIAEMMGEMQMSMGSSMAGIGSMGRKKKKGKKGEEEEPFLLKSQRGSPYNQPGIRR